MKATFSSTRQIDFKPIDNNETVLLEHMKDVSNNQLSFVKDEKYGDISLVINEPRNIAELDNLANRIIHMAFPERIRDLVNSHEIMIMKDGSKIECLVLTEEEPKEDPSDSEDLVAEFTDYTIKHITEVGPLLTISEGTEDVRHDFTAEYEGRTYANYQSVKDGDKYITLCKENGKEFIKIAFVLDKLKIVDSITPSLSVDNYKAIILAEAYEFDGKLASDNGVMIPNPVPEYIIESIDMVVGYELKGDKIVKVPVEESNTTTLPNDKDDCKLDLTEANDKYQSNVPEGYYVDPTAPCGYRKCRPGHIHGATYMHPDCCICSDHMESLMKRTILVRLISETLGEVVLFSIVGIDDVRINTQVYKVNTTTDMTILDVNKNSLFYDCFKI